MSESIFPEGLQWSAAFFLKCLSCGRTSQADLPCLHLNLFSVEEIGGGGQEIGGEGMTGVGTESRKCSGSAQASYTFTRKG